MFTGLKAPLKKGERVKGTLVFEKAGIANVEFEVVGIADKSPNVGEHGHRHAQ